MIKKFCVIIIALLFVSCSGLQKKAENTSIENVPQLTSKLELIQNELKQNDLSTLEKSLDIVSMKKKYILDNLKEYDLSKVNLSFSKPVIEGGKVKNTIAIRVDEEIFYYDLSYKYENGEWKIVDFKERR